MKQDALSEQEQQMLHVLHEAEVGLFVTPFHDHLEQRPFWSVLM
jgi:hypothetical protein